MRTAIAAATAFACAFGAFDWSPPAVHAEDTFPMLAGMQTNGNTEPRVFEWNYSAEGGIGVSKSVVSEAHYVAPVYWRTFPSGNRVLKVRGKRTSAAKPMFCSLFVIDQDGYVVSQQWKEFTVVGSYSWITLTVSGVTTNTTSTLGCEIPPQQGYLLMMSYTP